MKSFMKKGIILMLTSFVVLSSCISVFGTQIQDTSMEYQSFEKEIGSTSTSGVEYITIELEFSYPEIVLYEGYIVVRVDETDLNMMTQGEPVIPVNLSMFDLEFGSKILDVEYEHTPPEIINSP